MKVPFFKYVNSKYGIVSTPVSSAIGFRYASSTLNEITGINMKTKFQSEVNLVNAGTNQMKKGHFSSFAGGSPPDSDLQEITIVLSVPKLVLCRICFFHKIFEKVALKSF